MLLLEEGCGGNGITKSRSRAEKDRSSGAHNDLLLLKKINNNKKIMISCAWCILRWLLTMKHMFNAISAHAIYQIWVATKSDFSNKWNEKTHTQSFSSYFKWLWVWSRSVNLSFSVNGMEFSLLYDSLHLKVFIIPFSKTDSVSFLCYQSYWEDEVLFPSFPWWYYFFVWYIFTEELALACNISNFPLLHTQSS